VLPKKLRSIILKIYIILQNLFPPKPYLPCALYLCYWPPLYLIKKCLRIKRGTLLRCSILIKQAGATRPDTPPPPCPEA